MSTYKMLNLLYDLNEYDDQTWGEIKLSNTNTNIYICFDITTNTNTNKIHLFKYNSNTNTFQLEFSVCFVLFLFKNVPVNFSYCNVKT